MFGEANWVITDSRDQIRLEKENFQLTAQLLNVLDPFNIFLMQRKLLEAENEKFVVFRLLSNELLGNWGENSLGKLSRKILILQFTFYHLVELLK